MRGATCARGSGLYEGGLGAKVGPVQGFCELGGMALGPLLWASAAVHLHVDVSSSQTSRLAIGATAAIVPFLFAAGDAGSSGTMYCSTGPFWFPQLSGRAIVHFALL